MTLRLTHKLLAGAVMLACAGLAQAATLTISCGTVGQDYDSCKRLTDEWARKTGNTVQLLSIPNSSTEILDLYKKMFASHAADVDVVIVDAVWPAQIGEHLLDLKEAASDEVKKHFPALIQNNTVHERLVALPWFADVGLLYYRKDLLDKYQQPVPKTWEEFTHAARVVQEGERQGGRADFSGYVWEGKAYEGLTCNALEWVHSDGGGTFVDNTTGQISIDVAKTGGAFDRAAQWVGTISPKTVLGFGEEEARSVFQNGNAAFMRNWHYVWDLLQGADSRVKDKVGVALLPAGEAGQSATLGGWQLGGSKYSRHQKQATELVMYLTSEKIQKRRAIEGAYMPTYPALYRDSEVKASSPFFGELHDVLEKAVPRPAAITAARYNAVSASIWDAAHEVLKGQTRGEEAAKKLKDDLSRLKGERW